MLDHCEETTIKKYKIRDTVFIRIEARVFIFYKDYWPGVYMSPFHILYRHLFTLQCWTPVFIRAQVFIWALLLFG